MARRTVVAVERPEAGALWLSRPLACRWTERLVGRKENPSCHCGGRMYYSKGQYRPYFKCETCGDTETSGEPSIWDRGHDAPPALRRLTTDGKVPRQSRGFLIRRIGDVLRRGRR